MRFDETDLSDRVLDALDDMNFSECTPIQERAIPIVLEGRDLLAVAQTGTGKTAAYLLPIINELSEYQYPEDAVNCIIMAPTRELAQQIDRQMEGFSYFLPVTSVAVYGGTDGKEFARQERGLKMGADVVIATPGRLLAHLQMGYVDLSKVSFFVLDEADRMLDMGFIHDVKRLLPKLPLKKQTLFFSATMPDSIDRLAKSLLHNPARVEVTPASSVVEIISQSVYRVEKPQKKELLAQLLLGEAGHQVLVFSRTKHGADNIARYLSRRGIACESIHGDKSQNARQRALSNFKEGRSNVIIATDIAARGIDIKGLDLVLNFDLPDVPETYVHRIGRTGRAGCEGRAIAFCSSEEAPMLREIEKLTGIKLVQQKHNLPSLGEPAASPTTSSTQNVASKSQGRTQGGKSQNNRRREDRKRPVEPTGSTQKAVVSAEKPKRNNNRPERPRPVQQSGQKKSGSGKPEPSPKSPAKLRSRYENYD